MELYLHVLNFFALKMETASSLETMVPIYQITSVIPQEYKLDTHR
jgi:hypothetical protein